MKILYLGTELTSFLSHRLPMAKAAKAAGYSVHVAVPYETLTQDIESLGFTFHRLPPHRGREAFRNLIPLIFALLNVLRTVKPHLCHAVTVQSVVMIFLLKLVFLRVPILAAYTGLGAIFTNENPSSKQQFLQNTVRFILRLAHRKKEVFALVQNEDDAAFIASLSPMNAPELIAGSGVDIDHLHPLSSPVGAVTFGFAGRLLQDKGVEVLHEAFLRVKRDKPEVRLILAGSLDPKNPASLSEESIRTIASTEGVTWLGHIKDIKSLWAQCHIAVLPSRREGFPKTLLEAAACRRALIATDVPGCRALVKHNENGLLVPKDDAKALSQAMLELARNAAKRELLAHAARATVENGLDAKTIGEKTVTLYQKILQKTES